MKSRSVTKSYLLICLLLVIGLAYLMFYRLGTLTPGIAGPEVAANTATYGWHGIYSSILYFPLKVVHSLAFVFAAKHTIFLLRLPSAVLGFSAVVFYYLLIYLWHGKRTALLASILFASSAMTLHASRVASNDIIYLWGIIMLLLNHALFYRYYEKRSAYLLNFFIWGLLLTIPGFIFFVALDIFLQRKLVQASWAENDSLPIRVLGIVAFSLFLPMVVKSVLHLDALKAYFALPLHFPDALHILKNFAAVAVHLFIRGPEYPYLWLSKLPVLDFFSLALLLSGIYFYVAHYKSSRSRLLALFLALAVILIGLNGPVSFTLIFALAMVIASTGIAYLLHIWLKVFPLNPYARSLSIGLITLAVLISSLYNIRSYFIAWRLNQVTLQTFSKRL